MAVCREESHATALSIGIPAKPRPIFQRWRKRRLPKSIPEACRSASIATSRRTCRPLGPSFVAISLVGSSSFPLSSDLFSSSRDIHCAIHLSLHLTAPPRVIPQHPMTRSETLCSHSSRQRAMDPVRLLEQRFATDAARAACPMQSQAKPSSRASSRVETAQFWAIQRADAAPPQTTPRFTLLSARSVSRRARVGARRAPPGTYER